MASCLEPGCRLRLPCPKHPTTPERAWCLERTELMRARTTKVKAWKNNKRRIQYAQRHPITVAEVRELRNHPEVFDALTRRDDAP